MHFKFETDYESILQKPDEIDELRFGRTGNCMQIT